MRSRLLTATASGVLFLAACTSSDDGGGLGPSAQPSSDAQVVKVSATEFAFDVPAQVEGGFVAMEFSNTGGLLHEFAFGRIDPGKTEADVKAVIDSGDEPPAWMHDVAGVPTLSPGQTVTVTRDLEPGTYVFMCFFPSPDGTPHAQLGMYEVFQIAGDTGASAPGPDLVISASGDGLSVPAIPAGPQTVELRNDGPGKHSFFILRSEVEDATADEIFEAVDEWFGGGLEGPAPATFLGGMQTIPAGTSVFETITFDPGTYLVFDDATGDMVTVAVS